jgi:hypothetical protein
MTIEIVRRALAVAMVVGILLLPIAPIARVLNEASETKGGQFTFRCIGNGCPTCSFR